MNEQPEALRLAERLVGMEASSNDQYEAAAELRRLHEENERLREAVAAEREACAKICDGWASYGVPAVAAAAQAIRARGE
jgi:L-fucose isomerase-like protein